MAATNLQADCLVLTDWEWDSSGPNAAIDYRVRDYLATSRSK